MPPTVSVIIPCRNEEKTIYQVLGAIHAQTYPHDLLEVVIADGFSNDSTHEEIKRFQAQHPDLAVHVVDNPKKNIPAGLNTAIRASTGEIIVRMDAHSIPEPRYIACSVNALLSETTDNVGGVWNIQPQNQGWMACSIAAAAGHPIGVGDAQYRYTSAAAYVDTVPYGAFRRELIDRIGFFDETLEANEDYEFNTRIRQAGGRVWLDPQIRCVYFARPTFNALAKQYWNYGFWKAHMLRRYPGSLRWRQALPPFFVAGLILCLILGVFFKGFRWLFLGVMGVYLASLLAAGIQVAIKKRKLFYTWGVPLAIATMHFSWGTGFLWSLASNKKKEKARA